MRLFLLISFMFLSLVVHAEPANEPVDDRYVKFKITSLQLFSSFSSFIYFQGDDRNRARLQRAKNHGTQAFAALNNTDTELNEKWRKIIDYVELNEAHDFNGVDMSLEAGWSIHQREFNKIIDPLVLTDLNTIDDLQIKMETILSQYIGYANSTTGGYGVSYADVPLEKKVDHVSEELESLAQADIKYQSLQKKWNYIKGTLSAYNSNIAPFVVLHTFDSMREMIASD